MLPSRVWKSWAGNAETKLNCHEMFAYGKDEYLRGDAYSNTVEGYFNIWKRGIVGTFHHVSE